MTITPEQLKQQALECARLAVKYMDFMNDFDLPRNWEYRGIVLMEYTDIREGFPMPVIELAINGPGRYAEDVIKNARPDVEQHFVIVQDWHIDAAGWLIDVVPKTIER